MRVVRPLPLGIVTALQTLLLSSCGPNLPSVDRCSEPTTAGVTSVSFLSPTDATTSVMDSQPHPVLSGPQGGSMVELRLGLPGQEVPSCASFELSVVRCMNLDCTEIEDVEPFVNTWVLQTYEDASGRSTKSFLTEIPYRFGPGTLIQVTAKVADTESSLLMWLQWEGPLVDAGPKDGGLDDAAPDGAFLDAMP